jgi:Asp-tRNA(Asn)/Glu-tRNA(Gln) amidotransferase A subunit family amidase
VTAAIDPFAAATEMLGALRARRVSAVELLDLHISRIERHNPALDGLFYPAVATLAGQPSTAFPAGLTKRRLPIGLQVIGPYLEDRTPLRFAALVAQEWGGFTRPTGY